MGTDHQHRVCTYQEAEQALRRHGRVWVNDCYCRTPAKQGKAKWPYCGHDTKVCFSFAPPEEPEEKDANWPAEEIPLARALEVMADWKKQGNFFRFMMDDVALCCCCGCGCGWFRDQQGRKVKDGCQKSGFIEQTDAARCSLCGACVKVCAYEARATEDGKMKVAAAKCYGCSACEYACPVKAITMVPRTA